MALTKAWVIHPLKRLRICGYKSIADCDITLQPINLLIGANGAGKSNLISFFRFLSDMLRGQLQQAVTTAGGPDAVLHCGRKYTESLSADIYFAGPNRYCVRLQPTQQGQMMFLHESLQWGGQHRWESGSVHLESQVDHAQSEPGLRSVFVDMVEDMRRWRVYHFHDTGSAARVKQMHGLMDNQYLSEDARNLAAFLYRLKIEFPDNYARIIATIRLVAPYFDDFDLRPHVSNSHKIELWWTQRGIDEPFHGQAFSDGTLRFICLATALLQPWQLMPSAILIDEPELGLHPYAISVLAALIKSASVDVQLIISTQSAELINHFKASDLIVMEHRNNASTLVRLNEAELKDWLEDYTLGQLWTKNVFGGSPE